MKLKQAVLVSGAAVFLGLVGLAVTATSASAYIACNGSECWHTDRRVTAPGVHFDFHPDDWYFHQHWDADRHFRDYHAGRGYYKDGVWVTL